MVFMLFILNVTKPWENRPNASGMHTTTTSQNILQQVIIQKLMCSLFTLFVAKPATFNLVTRPVPYVIPIMNIQFVSLPITIYHDPTLRNIHHVTDMCFISSSDRDELHGAPLSKRGKFRRSQRSLDNKYQPVVYPSRMLVADRPRG